MAENDKKNRSEAPNEPQANPTPSTPERVVAGNTSGEAEMEKAKAAAVNPAGTGVAKAVDEQAKKAARKEEAKEDKTEATMSSEMKEFAQIIADSIRGANTQVGYVQPVEGAAETEAGGRYMLNNRIVDANGVTLEPTAEEKKALDSMKKVQANAVRANAGFPTEEKDVIGGEL